MAPNGCVNSFPNSYKWASDNGSTGITTNTELANPTTKTCVVSSTQPSYTNIKWDRGTYYRVIAPSWTEISSNSSKNQYTFDAPGGTTSTLRANATPGNEHTMMNYYFFHDNRLRY